MLFNSFTFVVFFILVVVAYFSISYKYRNLFLLFFSYAFYCCWNLKYGILLAIVTVSTYIAALFISKKDFFKKRFLLTCIIFNVGLLFFFKYFNFSINALNDVLGLINNNSNKFSLLNIILPVGISFYIFQALAYVIDVYKKKVQTETNIIDYALFISFFPQLLSGPIGRANLLMPQIKKIHYFKYLNARDGLELFLWGCFKKIVIADRLSIYVDKVFDHLGYFSTSEILLASFFFSIQIYCDFSGYSDMAVGVAKVMGYNLTRNFERPYFANSVSDFWRKWHISLSTWLKDYIYIPLGGNRVSKYRHKFNIITTFVVSGIWHGANWTFIFWGLIHGIAQVVESFFSFNLKSKIFIFTRRLFVFFFVSFAWIFFRANNMQDAFYILGKLSYNADSFVGYSNKFISGIDFVTFNNVVTHTVINYLTIFSLSFFVLTQFAIKNDCVDIYLNVHKKWVRIVFNSLVFFLILFCGVFDSTKFIYFQF